MRPPRVLALALTLPLLLTVACTSDEGTGAAAEHSPSEIALTAPDWYDGDFDALQAAMLHAYQSYFDRYVTLEQEGGVAALPDEFSQWVMDPALTSISDYLVGMHQGGLSEAEDYQAEVLAAVQLTSGLDADAEGGLDVCEQYTGAIWTDPEGSEQGQAEPFILEVNYYFKRDTDNVLKIYGAAIYNQGACSLQQ